MKENILNKLHSYVYKKDVNWSLLHQGFTIPVTIQVVFQNNIESFIPRGQSRDIILELEGNPYKAKLVNQAFNYKKYPSRKDILQIRYNPQSEIAKKFRSIFTASYRYIKEQRDFKQEGHRLSVKLPDDHKETLTVYTTPYNDTFFLDCITKDDSNIIRNLVVNEDEQEYEMSVNYSDPESCINLVPQMVKVRRFNKAIGNNLKLLYDFRCQMCNDNFSRRYEVNIVESHHINPFLSSLNNDSANQIIICPNHHRVIHKANPTFNRSKLLFKYDNGLQEKVLLNLHL